MREWEARQVGAVECECGDGVGVWTDSLETIFLGVRDTEHDTIATAALSYAQVAEVVAMLAGAMSAVAV